MLVGYRGWSVRTINGELTLVSPISHMAWAPGENTARCSKCILDMDKHCTCGFYALKEPELWSQDMEILGQVFLWGKVVEGEKGYRAKKAQVSLLLMPSVKPMSEEQLDALSVRYNAPLMKAKGNAYDILCHARSLMLQKSGALNLVRSQNIRQQMDRRRFPRGRENDIGGDQWVRTKDLPH